MLKPFLKKNDKQASILIILVSLIVFIAITALASIKIDVKLPFDPHIFAGINAALNATVSILLLAALWAVRKHNFELHKKIMLTAILLSVMFLISYIAHHLLTDATKFGDLNLDGIISPEEKEAAGPVRIVYYILLLTHIPLAGIILPFILFTAYRAGTGEYSKHKKLARFTWPVWFYVAVSGVLVYLLIEPYYA